MRGDLVPWYGQSLSNGQITGPSDEEMGYFLVDRRPEFFSVVLRQLAKPSQLNGLRRNPAAPACNRRARIFSSKYDVMKMTGTRLPAATKCSLSSAPFMPGMCRSVMRQLHSSTPPASKYSSADENTLLRWPSERTSLAIPSRTNGSSSMIDIT